MEAGDRAPLTAQRRHGLDVVRVREQVEGPQSHELVAARSEQRDIPGERDGIARHVNELRRGELDELVDDRLARAGARWIEHDGRLPKSSALSRTGG